MQTVVAWPALALIGGAACGTFARVPLGVCGGLLALSWVVAVAACARPRPTLVTTAVALGFASGAALLGDRAAAGRYEPTILRYLSDDPIVVEGVLREDAARTEFGAIATIDVAGVQIGAELVPAAGGVRLSIGGAHVERALPAWRAGRRLRVTATLRRPVPYLNFGVPDQERKLALGGIRLIGSVKSAALVTIVAAAPVWQEASSAVRLWSRGAIDRAAARQDAEAAAIVTAVLIGDRAGLSVDVERRLQRAGTFHIIAISGGNVAIVAGLVVWSLARSGLRPRWRAAIAIAALAAYAATVMGGASVARATVAAAVYLAARVLDLRTASRNVIVVTLAALLACDPLLVADTGFWLTFIASLAIVEQAAWVAAHIGRGAIAVWPLWSTVPARAAFALLAATLAAEAALVPIAAYAFSQVTVAGLLLNFAAIPLMAIVQGAGLATLGVALVSPEVAIVPGTIAAWSARAILDSARLVDLAPWAVLTVPPPPVWLVALAVTTWAVAWLAPARVVRVGGVVLWVSALTTILRGPVLPDLPDKALRFPPCRALATPSDMVKLNVVDVAQGTAVLLRVPHAPPMLVDAGGAGRASRFDVGARIVAPSLWALGVRGLGIVVLTHADRDHVGGAAAIVRSFTPREIWEGIAVPNLPPMDEIRAAAERADLAWVRVRRGVSRRLGEAAIHVRHPPPPEWERRRVRNDDSIVLEVKVGQILDRPAR